MFLINGDDRDSNPHAHLAQPLQKILLNHLHLIALAGSLPLRWPLDLRNFYAAFSVLTRYGSFIFAPDCDITIDEYNSMDGSSKFFFKQLMILMFPFLAIIAVILFWTAVRFFPSFLDTACILRLRHLIVRCKRKCLCCLPTNNTFSDGSDRPMNASEVFDRFHQFAHESASHFTDGTHHLRLSRLSIFDLLYALSVDGRHRELYTRFHTKAADDDIHHEITTTVLIPLDAIVDELMSIKFLGANHSVNLLVPENAVPGQLCDIKLDKGTQQILGHMECVYLSMKPEELHGTVTFQNFLKWYITIYAHFVHNHASDIRRDLDRDEDLIEQLDFVLRRFESFIGPKHN